ncbi:MAG: hypothetical protein KDB57_04265 [Solirubrobacterales bacterium]|nr:hypothetical protein [Solirubrobacterales bacterium]
MGTVDSSAKLSSEQQFAMHSVWKAVVRHDSADRTWTMGRKRCVVYGRLPKPFSFKVLIGTTRTRVLVWIDKGPGHDLFNKTLFDDLERARGALDRRWRQREPNEPPLIWDRKDGTARAAAIELPLNLGVRELQTPREVQRVARLVIAMHDTFDDVVASAVAGELDSFDFQPMASVDQVLADLLRSQNAIEQLEEITAAQRSAACSAIADAQHALESAESAPNDVPVVSPQDLIQCPGCGESYALRTHGEHEGRPAALVCESCGVMFDPFC